MKKQHIDSMDQLTLAKKTISNLLPTTSTYSTSTLERLETSRTRFVKPKRRKGKQEKAVLAECNKDTLVRDLNTPLILTSWTADSIWRFRDHGTNGSNLLRGRRDTFVVRARCMIDTTVSLI